MSTEQITQEAIELSLPERVSLAKRLWESFEYGLADAEEKNVIAEAARRDDELTAGVPSAASTARVCARRGSTWDAPGLPSRGGS